jgi:hypothetical protein
MTTAQHRYASFSYEEEYEAILSRYREKKRLTPIQYQLIKYHHLIEELEKIVTEENIPLIDNVTIVDQDRLRLSSWVHLTEEANLRLAEALKAVIEPYVEGKFAVSRQHEPQPHPHQCVCDDAKTRWLPSALQSLIAKMGTRP